MTTVHYASKRSDTAVLKELVANGGDLFAVGNVNCITVGW